MSEPISAKSFLGLVKKSGLVPEEKLLASLKKLSQHAQGKPISLEQLTSHFLAEGLITHWQCEQLAQGRHKGFFLGQYRLLRLLGSGGMSAVYLAQHMIAGHFRAIKVLPKSRASDKSYLDRFYLEGRAAASLRHPNIAQIIDLASENDLHYMVMELVEGTDLDQLVKAGGPLDFSLALTYLNQIADALRHAHSRNIIHRDIKPANIVVSKDQKTAKLLDLGLALMRDQETSITVLHNERVMGTADYLSPEQAIDSHRIDQRADIYSLGCTFYFMLVGHPPFPEGTIAQRIAKHQTQEPVDLALLRPDCPLAIVRLCQRMMKKKVEDRFLDCQELLDAIQKARALIQLDQQSKVGLGADLKASPKNAGPSNGKAHSEKPDSNLEPGVQIAPQVPGNEGTSGVGEKGRKIPGKDQQKKPRPRNGVAPNPGRSNESVRNAKENANRQKQPDGKLSKSASSESDIAGHLLPTLSTSIPAKVEETQPGAAVFQRLESTLAAATNKEKFSFADSEVAAQRIDRKNSSNLELEQLVGQDIDSTREFSSAIVTSEISAEVARARLPQRKDRMAILIVSGVVFMMFSILIGVLILLSKFLKF